MLAKSPRTIREEIFRRLQYAPTTEQAEFHLYDLSDKENRIKQLVGGEQAGKLMDIFTPIPTPSGWKLLRDIEAGEYVLDDAGERTLVEEASMIETSHPCFSILFDDGSRLVASDTHLWVTQTSAERRSNRRGKIGRKEVWQSPTALVEQQRLWGIRTTEEIKQTLLIPKCGKMIANHSITNPLPIKYETKKLLIHPYLLGAWLGDGDSSGGQITTGDTFIIEKIQQLGYEVNKVHSSYYRWRVVGLTTQLKQLNVLRNKHIPDIYLQGAIEQRLELLRGLMDSDGSIAQSTNGSCEFYNKNDGLVQGIRELLASLGIKSFLRSKQARLYGKDCGLAHTLSFKSSFPAFCLPRKAIRQKVPRTESKSRYIWQVEPVEPVPVKCLRTTSHLFLAGKSYIPTHNSLATAREIISRAPVEGRLYWLCGIDYSIPRKEFEYLLEDAKELKLLDPKSLSLPTDKHKEASLRLLSGATIVTKSFKDIVRAMTKESPDGIAVCEAAQTEWTDIERCLSRLAASQGWLVLSGTHEGSVGWYAQKYKEWQVPNREGARSFSMPSWSNIHIYKGGIDNPEIARLRVILPEDKFLERFAAVPCPATRLVIPEFRNEIHVGNYSFDIANDVELAVDPGYAGAYAVLAIQSAGEVICVVDEVYLQGYTTEQVIEICQLKPWWKSVKAGVIDIAGRQHQAMEAPVDVWFKKAGIMLKSTKVNEEEGINRLRSFLKRNPVTDKPQLFVNYTCSGLIAECDGGKSPVEGGGAWLRDKHTHKPLSRANHSCKALIYYLVDRFGYTTVGSRQPVGAISGYNPFVI